MRLRRRLFGGTAGAIAAILGLASPADAQCEIARSLVLDVPGVTTFYYVDNIEPPGSFPCYSFVCTGSFVIYEENATAGLQRGGAQWLMDKLGQGGLDIA